MAEIPGEKRRGRLNWSEGFRRVAILLWVVGSLAIVALFVSVGSLHRPFENVCATEDANSYKECFQPGQYERRANRDWLDPRPLPEPDPNRSLVRWTIPTYRANALGLVVGVVVWTVAVWGTFYLIAWIARGFTRGGGRG